MIYLMFNVLIGTGKTEQLVPKIDQLRICPKIASTFSQNTSHLRLAIGLMTTTLVALYCLYNNSSMVYNDNEQTNSNFFVSNGTTIRYQNFLNSIATPQLVCLLYAESLANFLGSGFRLLSIIACLGQTVEASDFKEKIDSDLIIYSPQKEKDRLISDIPQVFAQAMMGIQKESVVIEWSPNPYEVNNPEEKEYTFKITPSTLSASLADIQGYLEVSFKSKTQFLPHVLLTHFEHDTVGHKSYPLLHLQANFGNSVFNITEYGRPVRGKSILHEFHTTYAIPDKSDDIARRVLVNMVDQKSTFYLRCPQKTFYSYQDETTHQTHVYDVEDFDGIVEIIMKCTGHYIYNPGAEHAYPVVNLYAKNHQFFENKEKRKIGNDITLFQFPHSVETLEVQNQHDDENMYTRSVKRYILGARSYGVCNEYEKKVIHVETIPGTVVPDQQERVWYDKRNMFFQGYIYFSNDRNDWIYQGIRVKAATLLGCYKLQNVWTGSTNAIWIDPQEEEYFYFDCDDFSLGGSFYQLLNRFKHMI